MNNLPNLLNTLNEKINFLIKELKDEKTRKFVEDLNKKLNEITKDLTHNLEGVFLKEKEVSLQIVNLNNISE